MVIETPGICPLFMDRQDPLGNSLDVFLRRALHVKIGNKVSEAIPIYITDIKTNPTVNVFTGQNSPGATITLFNLTVPVDTLRAVYKIIVSSNQPGKFTIKKNASLIGSKRLGPANLNQEFIYTPPLLLSAADNIKVEFITPPFAVLSDIEAYLISIDTLIGP